MSFCGVAGVDRGGITRRVRRVPALRRLKMRLRVEISLKHIGAGRETVVGGATRAQCVAPLADAHRRMSAR